MTFRVGSKNGQTVYWDGKETDRFICVAMSPTAAEAIARALNAVAFDPGADLTSLDFAWTCPTVPKRET